MTKITKAEEILNKETELADNFRNLQKQIEDLTAQKMKAAKKAAEDAVAEFGLNIEDVFEIKVKKEKTKSTPAIAKYKLNEHEWSGRGKKPKWVTEFIETGGQLSDIEV